MEVTQIDPDLEIDSNGFRTAVILLSALAVGPNIKKIAKFTGYTRKEIAERSKNLRKNKIWVGGKTNCDWFGEDGGIEFTCDSLVADGLMNRVEQK